MSAGGNTVEKIKADDWGGSDQGRERQCPMRTLGDGKTTEGLPALRGAGLPLLTEPWVAMAVPNWTAATLQTQAWRPLPLQTLLRDGVRQGGLPASTCTAQGFCPVAATAPAGAGQGVSVPPLSWPSIALSPGSFR